MQHGRSVAKHAFVTRSGRLEHLVRWHHFAFEVQRSTLTHASHARFSMLSIHHSRHCSFYTARSSVTGFSDTRV